jgi:hypothetical protein
MPSEKDPQIMTVCVSVDWRIELCGDNGWSYTVTRHDLKFRQPDRTTQDQKVKGNGLVLRHV